MPFGILEDYKMENVPGTSSMADNNGIPQGLTEIPHQALKHGTGKYADLILVPQPTDDPNDPLNWPTWRKDLILLIVGLLAAVVGAFGPMLSPGFVEVSRELGISVNALAQSTSWLILTIGISLFIANPLAKIYGKRPIYLMASVIMFVGSVWGAGSKSYGSFLGSRVVSGLGMAPYEVLVQCTIGDLYFIHQRGTRIALWNLFLLCGIAGGSLISGYIIEDLGWKWTFWVCAIFFGVLLILVIFFVPETAYHRPPPQAYLSTTRLGDTEKSGSIKLEQNEVVVEESEESQAPIIAKRISWLRSLCVYTGVYSRAPFWKIAVRPLIIFWYPAVLWSFLVYGTTLSWIVVFSVVNASIFTLAPYNFTVSQTGLISLSPFILTLVGEVISGPLNDYICVRLTKWNNGTYEPEFRMVLMIAVLLIGVAGFFGFGATVHFQTHWIGPVLTFGLANMSMAFANVCVFGYVLDSYGSLTEEAFVAINARNFLTFGVTYFVNNWLARDGTLSVFSILGSAFVVVCLMTIPLWVFGKRIRSKIARTDWLTRFMTNEY